MLTTAAIATGWDRQSRRCGSVCQRCPAHFKSPFLFTTSPSSLPAWYPRFSAVACVRKHCIRLGSYISDRPDSVDPAAAPFAFVFLPTSLAAESVSGAHSALLAQKILHFRSYHTTHTFHHHAPPPAPECPPPPRRAPPAPRQAQAHHALAPAPRLPRARAHRHDGRRPRPPRAHDPHRPACARNPLTRHRRLLRAHRHGRDRDVDRVRGQHVERAELADVGRVDGEQEEEQGVHQGALGPLGRDPRAVRRRGGAAAPDACGDQRERGRRGCCEEAVGRLMGVRERIGGHA